MKETVNLIDLNVRYSLLNLKEIWNRKSNLLVDFKRTCSFPLIKFFVRSITI